LVGPLPSSQTRCFVPSPSIANEGKEAFNASLRYRGRGGKIWVVQAERRKMTRQLMEKKKDPRIGRLPKNFYALSSILRESDDGN
jgi:hypothetical protein